MSPQIDIPSQDDVPPAAPWLAAGAWRCLLDQAHPRWLGPAGFVQDSAVRHQELYLDHPALTDEYLFRPDQDQFPLPMDQFSLAHLASGVDKLYARSDWTQDATWLRFECGDFFNPHQHFEVGDLEMFRREPLAVETGHYDDWVGLHAINWYTGRSPTTAEWNRSSSHDFKLRSSNRVERATRRPR